VATTHDEGPGIASTGVFFPEKKSFDGLQSWFHTVLSFTPVRTSGL